MKTTNAKRCPYCHSAQVELQRPFHDTAVCIACNAGASRSPLWLWTPDPNDDEAWADQFKQNDPKGKQA